LSQLAARGMTKDGRMILMPVGLAMRCGLGQSALRGRILFWTVGGRAPAPGHLGAGSFPVGPLGRTPCQNHFALDVWGNWRLAVAERRKKVAHGETVGGRTRLNQAPDGAEEICAGRFSAAPAGALVAG
jgi:hypothetical protein